MFQFRHHNRLTYPQKHIMICEDVITNQKNILNHFHDIFDPEGLVQISVVPGALAAAAILSSGCKVDLILLDHDMPEGNGTDLLNWMKNTGKQIPIITFSGIPYNNHHMINLGATHCFGKNDVVTGQADDVIRNILGLKLENRKHVVEYYTNTASPSKPVIPRYWINSDILIGGNIIDENDYKHLQKDFGICKVINVDGIPDQNKGIDNLLECPVEDNGDPFSKEKIKSILDFASEARVPIYLHCHLGMSRSPHFAYAILRGVYKLSSEEALSKVTDALPSERHVWGFNQHTTSYIKSIEDALKDL